MIIIGIGESLIDVFACVEKDTPIVSSLRSRQFNKIPDYKIKALITTLKNPIIMAGGMAANTIKIAAQLGFSSSFCSCIATDQAGQTFEKELHEAGVLPFLQKTEGPSGTCIIFLIPGSPKNPIATFSSISNHLFPSPSTYEKALQQSELVVLEGHLLEREESFATLLQHCQELNLPICLSLGTSTLFTDNNKEKIVKLAHQSEIHYLFIKGKVDHDEQEQELLKTLSPFLKGFVINRGLSGILLHHNNQNITLDWPSSSDTIVVDATGSHDALVAGYLWAVDHQYNPFQAGQCGLLTAAAITQVIGTRLNQEQLPDLIHQMTLVGESSSHETTG